MGYWGLLGGSHSLRAFARVRLANRNIIGIHILKQNFICSIIIKLLKNNKVFKNMRFILVFNFGLPLLTIEIKQLYCHYILYKKINDRCFFLSKNNKSRCSYPEHRLSSYRGLLSVFLAPVL